MFSYYGSRLDIAILNKFDPYRIIFSQIALVFISYLILKLGYLLLKAFWTFILPHFVQRDFIKEYGQWAVITGCTQGVGRSYAHQLAKRGMSLVLIARNLAKLEALEREMKVKYPAIQIEFVVADFAQGPHIFKIIEDGLNNKDIGILVNNVGVSYPHPLHFNEVRAEDILDMINVNVIAATMMTQIILPKLEQKKRGAIVNVASVSALKPFPFLSVYSATKAYVDFFSRGLASECSGKGVTIQTLTPAGVCTQMTANFDEKMRPSMFIPSPDTFAASAVKTLGFSDYTTGYWAHSFQEFLSPIVFNTFIMKRVFMRIRNENIERSKSQ